MAAEHIVEAGECLASIAHDQGISLEALSEANAELKELRGEFGILAQGDSVVLPGRTPKAVELSAPGRHRIRFHSTTNPVVMRFVTVTGDSRSLERVVLHIEGVSDDQALTTNGNGEVTFMIPAYAKTGVLTLGDPGMRMPVTFGALDPSETVSGAQGRLKHLGFYRGVIDGKLGPRTHEAVRALQRDEGIEPTAELDPETLDKIRDRSGGV